MKNKLHILALGVISLCLMASCSVHRDRERIETAEALLYSNRDSVELLLRQVERPERLDDEHLAKYWFITCDLLDCIAQDMAEAVTVEQVVAQNEATRFAAKKLFAQYKSLRKSVRHELNFVLQAHA